MNLTIVGRFLLPIAAAAAFAACASEEPPPPARPQAAPPPAQMPGAPAGAPAEKAKVDFKEHAQEGPGALTAFADADEIVGEAPHTVKLNVDVVENTGNPPFKFIWDFGDATDFSTEKSPSHTYKIPGSFRASVIITDSKGETDQDYVDVSVNEDIEYVITPEQLREALPPEEILKKAREAQKKAGGAQAVPPGPAAGAAPGAKAQP